MKVIGIYDKDSELRCFHKNPFFVIQSFLAKLPDEYGQCYFTNLETLKLLKVDEFDDERVTGTYNGLANVIMFSKNNALGHELLHVASYDRYQDLMAFDAYIGIEGALIEGMTEYLSHTIYDIKTPHKYPFEVFCIKMLEDIPDLFKSYFIPSHEEFVNIFPNKRSIYSLMYALNIYHKYSLDYMCQENTDDEFNLIQIEKAFKGVIDSLISIELSKNTDSHSLNKYTEKFMDEINISEVKDILQVLYPEYHAYVNKQINTKIRKREGTIWKN